MMILALALLLAAAPSFAATTPLEEDFPDGYWDREVGTYGGRGAGMTYSVNLAVSDPSRCRGVVEAALKGPGSKLINFSDQSAAMYQGGGDMAHALRMRPVYTLSYQVPESKAAALSRKLIGMGRLLSYNAQSPYANPQTKDIEERIEWIEKEMKRSAGPLKTMPVSRAMLESKLKRLRASENAVKSTAGTATVTVQITREDPEPGPKPAPAATP